MGAVVVGALVMVMGVVAFGLGIAVMSSGLRVAHRIHDRAALRTAGTLDGWDAWFFSGFSTMAVGVKGIYAITAWFVWTLIGMCLIGLGIRLFGRF